MSAKKGEKEAAGWCDGSMCDINHFTHARCVIPWVPHEPHTVPVTVAEVEAAKYLVRHGDERDSVRRIAESR